MINKEERIQEFLKDKEIGGFIKANSFDNQFVLEHFFAFEDAFTSKQCCSKCKGLNNCTQRKKGQYIGLEYEGLLNNNIVLCEYAKAKEEVDDIIDSYVYCDIPRDLTGLDLSNIEVKEQGLKKGFVEIYKLYEGKNKKGCYIYGDLGIGKTYLCVALANSLVQNKKKVAFIKVNDFVTKMGQLIREESNNYESILRNIQKCDVVILDDIGSEVVSEFSRDRLLFNILDYRMENKRTTIFTSNLDKKSLKAHFEQGQEGNIKAKRIMERIDILSEDCLLKGEDKRRVNK